MITSSDKGACGAEFGPEGLADDVDEVGRREPMDADPHARGVDQRRRRIEAGRRRCDRQAVGHDQARLERLRRDGLIVARRLRSADAGDAQRARSCRDGQNRRRRQHRTKIDRVRPADGSAGSDEVHTSVIGWQPIEMLPEVTIVTGVHPAARPGAGVYGCFVSQLIIQSIP